MPLPDQLATGILGLSGGQFEINCYLKTELSSSTACFRERQGGLSGCGGVTYPHRRLSREGQGPPVPRPSSSHHLVPLTRVGSTCGSAQARPYPDGCGPDFRSALALEDPGPACRTHPRRGPWATAPALGVDWPGAVSGEGAVPPRWASLPPLQQARVPRQRGRRLLYGLGSLLPPSSPEPTRPSVQLGLFGCRLPGSKAPQPRALEVSLPFVSLGHSPHRPPKAAGLPLQVPTPGCAPTPQAHTNLGRFPGARAPRPEPPGPGPATEGGARAHGCSLQPACPQALRPPTPSLSSQLVPSPAPSVPLAP